MISPENPTGQKGKGGMGLPDPKDPDLAFSAAAADLGRGWKVRPFIKVPAHSTATMMDVDGPGTIKHIWIASSADLHDVARSGVLRSIGMEKNPPQWRFPSVISSQSAMGGLRLSIPLLSSTSRSRR